MSDGLLQRVLDKEYPVLVKGEGVYVFDRNGKRYLDAVGGAGVVTIGHGVKEIAEAMKEQAERISFSYSGAFDNLPQRELARAVTSLAPPGLDHVFFVSGGSEAGESALKIARQYHVERGQPGKYKVIGRWQSYHGNTIAMLSVAGRVQWRHLYYPYLLDFAHIHPPYCYRCPYGHTYPSCNVHCAHELENTILQEGPENISAFFVEPIIGTTATGVTPPPEYFPIVREICDRYEVLLICDEVITGMGRTGLPFAIQHWGVTPDLITIAKGLASGYTPLAAVLVHDKIVRAIRQGSGALAHGFTYAGNPQSCAVGNAVVKYLLEHKLIEAVAEKEAYLFNALNRLTELPSVAAVRGKGFYVGLELVYDKEKKIPYPKEKRAAQQLAARALDKGLYIIAGLQGKIPSSIGDHIQISPPFILEKQEIDTMVDILRESILEVQKYIGVA